MTTSTGRVDRGQEEARPSHSKYQHSSFVLNISLLFNRNFFLFSVAPQNMYNKEHYK